MVGSGNTRLRKAPLQNKIIIKIMLFLLLRILFLIKIDYN